MTLENKDISATKAKYTVVASSSELNKFKELAINHTKSSVKVPGFRPGKAPSEMVQKYADPAKLETEFLNHAIEELYSSSLSELVLRVVGEPKIAISKFVPFSTLEFSVEVPIIRNVKLPELTSLKSKLETKPVTDEQMDLNLKELQKRTAKFEPVNRAAKNGDQLLLDFEGTDAKSKEKLAPASAQDYRLILGDNSLIPGFEEKLVGMKPGSDKTFELTFPADYHDKSFSSRKVSFKVTLKEVNETSLAKLDDSFAATVGPFKSVKELKDQLKTQLKAENDRQANLDFENRLLTELSEKTKVELDDAVIDSEVTKLEAEAKQSAMYRGQTWQEFLASLGENEAEYLEKLKGLAASRIRGGLAIGEIATNEGIQVTDEQLKTQIDNLKRQYTDDKMIEELDKPENQREILMRMVTEQVLNLIKTKQKAKS